MKTKAQKRLEAIQRLERTPQYPVPLRGFPQGDGSISIESPQQCWDRRHAEAKRLRVAFNV